MTAKHMRLLAGVLVLSGTSATVAQQRDDYLPLQEGNRWELISSRAPDRMVLEVTHQDGAESIVQWSNPWIPGLRFRFLRENQQIFLTGLDTGQGFGPFPARSVYFDFSRRRDERWRNATGSFRIVATDQDVTTPAGRYRNCIEIETTDTQGQSMYWTFAPNIGYVRFGRGNDAFLLTSLRTGARQTAGEPGADMPAASRRAPLTGPPLVSVDVVPSSLEGFGPDGIRKAYQKVASVGVGYLHAAPTWAEVEPTKGQYQWEPVDFRVELADQYKLPVNLNFRVVDTNNRSVPRPYANWKFNDPRMAEQLRAALQALGKRTRGRVRWIAIGNEIDAYFGSHRDEIGEYAELLRRVIPVVREVIPDAMVTANFTFGALADLRRYEPITTLLDCYSFTYYPLNADFTMRPPDVARDDIARMVQAAGDRPLIIQEVGYASSERLNGSEEKQAAFVTNVFEALRRHRREIIGATFLFLSDLPESVVTDLSKYYKLPNSDNFKAYLSSLGLFDRSGRPKPAWDVFRRETEKLSSNWP